MQVVIVPILERKKQILISVPLRLCASAGEQK
jgi:hypothetical protein